MLKITTRGREMEIPEYLDELTPDQYRFFLRLYLAFSNGMINADEMRRLWLSRLIGMADYTILLPEYIAELDRCLPALDGFFQEDGTPQLLTSRNLLPEEGGFRGPGDWLRGLTFGEFVEALTIMELMSEAPTEEEIEEGGKHLARLLYKIPEEVEIPPILLLHAPRLVANIWRAIQARPVIINGREIDFRIIFQSVGNRRSPDDRTGWTGIAFEIAEKGLFGRLEDVEKTDFWTVLIYLYKCKFEYINDKDNQV